ncbi:MAG: 16S rRNA (cytosine(967)-C(5))-methyltransferase RsmB [Gemmataceae bacterium]
MKSLSPSMSALRGARGLSLQVLLDCQQRNAFIQECLDQRLQQVELTPLDRRLATQLAYGVLRRRGTLDYLIQRHCSRPHHQVEPLVWELLRLGAYQLLLLTHIPPHAAIYETVELAERWGQRRAKGFINGILRALAGLLTPDEATTPAANALPLEHHCYRRLARAVLPDPGTNMVEYFTTGFALPKWLCARWLQRFAAEECLRLGFWFASPAPLWLRVNPLRLDRESFLKHLAEAGNAAEPRDHPQAVRLREHAAIRDLPGYNQGWFTVQDESAMQVASALAPAPGSRVLDLCAAPGGKTTHLAELMGNQGEIIACDSDDRRLRTVRELCQRLGITNVRTQCLHIKDNEEPPPGPFDAILVDVPCGNTGVLGRRPEIRWRLKPGDFQTLVPLQTKLLLQAAERIRPGGAIVYSTCSIEPDENRQVVNNVLTAMPDLALEADREQISGKPADGGYWARLRRKGVATY